MNQIDLESRQEQFQNKVTLLIEKLPEESATRRQLFNHKELFNDSVNYLTNQEHNLTFIGDIGVGKTTAICHLLGLIDDNAPILSTGAGRTTLCEVEICQGNQLAIEVTPCNQDEVFSYLNDFSQYLIQDIDDQAGGDKFKLSIEVERALRNMLELKTSRHKNEEGKSVKKDAAIIFASDFKDTNSLALSFMDRIKFQSRSRTAFTDEEGIGQMSWLSETFRAINSATHPEVGLAKRILITLPKAPFDDLNYSLSVVDTKGVDNTVNRQDLDASLTDNRAVCIICCGFTNAPSKTVSDLFKTMRGAGLTKQRIKDEIVLLILDREGEAEQVIDIDQAVGDKQDGRQIRAEHVTSDLERLFQLDPLDVQFLDVQTDKVSQLSKHLSDKVSRLRNAHKHRLEETEEAVSSIEREMDSKSKQQAEQQVKSTLGPWLKKANSRSPVLKEYFLQLISEIEDSGTYASSIRASINRRGEWHNLDYYQMLAVGARKQIVEQVGSLHDELFVLIQNMLSQNDLQPAYALLKQLKDTTDKRLNQIYLDVFSKGRSVYESKLFDDIPLWRQLGQEWGQGPGYKGRVAEGSMHWFQQKNYPSFELTVSELASARWKRYVEEIRQLLFDTNRF